MVTHLFNGMGPMHHRAPGLAGAALDDSRLVPSIISDFVHVHPAMVGLALARRTDAVLVTDSVGVGVGGAVVERAGAAYLADGTLAGSTLTMDAAVRNVVSIGTPVAARGAARVREPGAGARRARPRPVAPGARADLVALDPRTLAVEAVWVAGVPV